jgi:hypothetical protein
MVALFDHEEIGSDSAQGAGSPVMLDALSRITSSFNSDSKVLFISDSDFCFRKKNKNLIVTIWGEFWISELSLLSECYSIKGISFGFYFIGSHFIHASSLQV